MKKRSLLFAAILAIAGWSATYGQEMEAEVPGDNFSLEGALQLFKKSSSPQEFEKLLNSEDSKVNNLDLNGDGYIDYIRVIDRQEGNVHAFILQAVVSENQSQDVAVIELQKLDNGKAVLQIIGDEDIYGVETIIEPTDEVQTYAGTTTSRVVVNVWAWPSVQYVYGPYYSAWISPWTWVARPVWWYAWRPIAYYHYYPIWRPFRPYYSVCSSYRIGYAHRLYRPFRTTSVIVYNRHHRQIAHYRDDYRNGRTRDDRGHYANGSSNGRSSGSNGRQRTDERGNYDRGSSATQSSRPQRDGYRTQQRTSPTRSTADPMYRQRSMYNNERRQTASAPARTNYQRTTNRTLNENRGFRQQVTRPSGERRSYSPPAQHRSSSSGRTGSSVGRSSSSGGGHISGGHGSRSSSGSGRGSQSGNRSRGGH